MVVGAVAKDVIFKIGSSGSAATALKFAAVAAAVGLMVKKLLDVTKHAQRFGQMIKRTEIDMSTFGASTKGLIDTFESFAAVNQLTVSNMKVTREEVDALGKAAIEMARATDGDATAAFKSLTSQIAKGSTRVMKEMGIDFKKTGNLAQDQAMMVDLLVKKYRDLDIQVETNEERFYRFNNVIGTLQDQLALGGIELFGEAMGDTGNIIGEVTAILEKFSDDIVATDGQLAKWALSVDGITHAYQLLGNTILDKLIPWTDEYSNRIETLNDNYDKQLVKMKLISDAAGRLKTAGASLGEFLQSQATNQRTLDEMKELEINFDEEERKKKKKKRKSGKVDTGFDAVIVRQVDISKTLLEIQEKLSLDTNSIIEAQLQDEQRMKEENLAHNEKIADIRLGKLDKYGEQLLSQSAINLAILDEELKRAEEMHLDHEAKILSIKRDSLQEQIYAHNRAERDKEKATLGGMQFLRDVSSLQETESKKAFQVGKAAAIAEATISTALGAQKAFTSLAGIPIVGPALGAVAATAAVVAGGIQIKKIVDTKWGGGSSSSSASASFNPSVSSGGSNASVNQGQQQEIHDRRPIQIIMNSKMITDQVINDSIVAQRQGDRGLQVRV